MGRERIRREEKKTPRDTRVCWRSPRSRRVNLLGRDVLRRALEAPPRLGRGPGAVPPEVRRSLEKNRAKQTTKGVSSPRRRRPRARGAASSAGVAASSRSASRATPSQSPTNAFAGFTSRNTTCVLITFRFCKGVERERERETSPRFSRLSARVSNHVSRTRARTPIACAAATPAARSCASKTRLVRRLVISSVVSASLARLSPSCVRSRRPLQEPPSFSRRQKGGGLVAKKSIEAPSARASELTRRGPRRAERDRA